MLDYQQKRYYDTGCKEPRCSLCHFNGPVHFLMHGIPDGSLIDRQFIFIPQEQKTKTVEMIGYTGNKIEWDESNNQWIIRDSNNVSGKIIAYLNISKTLLPIGRNIWYEMGGIDDVEEKTLPLKLSRVNIILRILYLYQYLTYISLLSNKRFTHIHFCSVILKMNLPVGMEVVFHCSMSAMKSPTVLIILMKLIARLLKLTLVRIAKNILQC